MIKTFTDRYPFVGPAFWIASVQYFIIQWLVSMAWTMPYSWQQNTISDLGNTVCGSYAARHVCSPLHTLMNASFIILGVTMVMGSILIYHEFKKSHSSAIGFSFMALAGVGTILVGLFPENSNRTLHVVGATLPFLLGNISLVILGSALDIPKWLRYYTLIFGYLSLAAFILFTAHVYAGLGIGGMERLIVYPQTIWLIVFGMYISSNHMRNK